jgi:hypothetical protein
MATSATDNIKTGLKTLNGGGKVLTDKEKRAIRKKKIEAAFRKTNAETKARNKKKAAEKAAIQKDAEKLKTENDKARAIIAEMGEEGSSKRKAFNSKSARNQKGTKADPTPVKKAPVKKAAEPASNPTGGVKRNGPKRPGSSLQTSSKPNPNQRSTAIAPEKRVSEGKGFASKKVASTTDTSSDKSKRATTKSEAQSNLDERSKRPDASGKGRPGSTTRKAYDKKIADGVKQKEARSQRLNGKVARPTGNQNPPSRPMLTGSTWKPGAVWSPKPGSGMEPKSVETVKATKEWVGSKEGQAMLDLAMTIGLDKAGPVDRSVAAATSFMDGVMGRKKALMTIGQKLTDKKAMANGREAAELMDTISGYVKETSKSLGAQITKAASSAGDAAGVAGGYAKLAGKDISKAASSAADAAGDMTDEFVNDAMVTAKKTTSSISSFFKAAKAKAKAYVDDGGEEPASKKRSDFTSSEKRMQDAKDAYDRKNGAPKGAQEGAPKGALNLKSGPNKLDGASDEQLAANGMYRVKAFTRSDGAKIKQHYRKISKR